MKVALYLRVSTSDQHCEVQARELREYCERRGWEVVQEYQDEMSGAKKKRPGLDALMKDASLHKFDAVLVWKLDRFGRSVLHLTENVDKLKHGGIRFMAVSQGIDTDSNNPTSGLMLHILAAVAEFERELIRERTVSGVAKARADGKQLGRPKRLFRRDEAVRMRKEGMSWRAIAKELGVGTMTVLDAVRKSSSQPIPSPEAKSA